MRNRQFAMVPGANATCIGFLISVFSIKIHQKQPIAHKITYD